ncbi:MAG: hypothetical protein O2829_04745 [Bacteroidetes bacterium]|nr:hypothetical protein [Bacteroidota bacterium]MDA1268382.1 hypothetical protein [Bacteroidota bacterium]
MFSGAGTKDDRSDGGRAQTHGTTEKQLTEGVLENAKRQEGALK